MYRLWRGTQKCFLSMHIHSLICGVCFFFWIFDFKKKCFVSKSGWINMLIVSLIHNIHVTAQYYFQGEQILLQGIRTMLNIKITGISTFYLFPYLRLSIARNFKSQERLWQLTQTQLGQVTQIRSFNHIKIVSFFTQKANSEQPQVMQHSFYDWTTQWTLQIQL